VIFFERFDEWCAFGVWPTLNVGSISDQLSAEYNVTFITRPQKPFGKRPRIRFEDQ
jgi:hypothetical protein